LDILSVSFGGWELENEKSYLIAIILVFLPQKNQKCKKIGSNFLVKTDPFNKPS